MYFKEYINSNGDENHSSTKSFFHLKVTGYFIFMVILMLEIAQTFHIVLH